MKDKTFVKAISSKKEIVTYRRSALVSLTFPGQAERSKKRSSQHGGVLSTKRRDDCILPRTGA